jgi:excisionase family DNA binding protein
MAMSDAVQTELLKLPAAAEVLGVSTARLRQLLRAKLVPGVLVGGAWRVPARALEVWLARQTDEALARVEEARTQSGREAEKQPA